MTSTLKSTAAAFLLLIACGSPVAEPPAKPDHVDLVAIDPPAGAGAFAPELHETVFHEGVGGVLLSWIEPLGEKGEHGYGEHRVRFARWDGAWSDAREVTRGDDFFANWADRPAVFAAGEALLSHSLRKLGEDTFAYGVALRISSDGGATWTDAGLLHDDDSPEEHGFVTYVAEDGVEDAGVRFFWLDGRAMGHGEPMQLRTAVVDPSTGEASPSEMLDPRVCECCDTTAALTPNGPVVVYRDRSDDEIRDVWTVRRTADGWSEPMPVAVDGWQIHGCPVNGPEVQADGGRVAVAWFTAAGGRPRIQVAFSDDGGTSFGAPIVVDGEMPDGRVDLVLASDGAAWVSWLGSKGEDTGEDGEIRLRRVAASGTLGPVRAVATTTLRRQSGVPRMAAHGRDLVFVWVEDAEPRRLRAVRLAALLPAS